MSTPNPSPDPMKLNECLRPDADNLGEYVSDALSTIDGHISARDIAELYVDQNAVDGLTAEQYEQLAKLCADQVAYYL